MRARNCRHGFNPIDGPGLWCPACEAEGKHPRPPRSHRVLAWRYSLMFYRLIGRPPITVRWRGVLTELSPGPGSSVCVKSTTLPEDYRAIQRNRTVRRYLGMP